MLPKYQLPPSRKAASTINLDFNPDQVGAWLAKLPVNNVPEAAEKLCHFLHAFNRIELPASHRSQLADNFINNAHHLSDRLMQDIVFDSLPPDQTQFGLLTLGQGLLVELITMQKRLVLDAMASNLCNIGDLLAKLMGSIEKLMMLHYQNHTALPAGLWVDLHQSYLCAQQTGNTAHPAQHGETLADAYKSLLLLALADPYQFTRQELAWTRDLALDAASRTEVISADAGKKVLAPFLVQSEMDVPPQALARHYTKAQYDLLFETSGIARQLALLANAIKNRRHSSEFKLPPEHEWHSYQTLLNKLKLRWGSSKHRLVQRIKPAKESTFDVVLGLKNLELLAHQNSPGSAPIAHCTNLNDSAGGLALKHIGGSTLPISVGEVIAIKLHDQANWQIGLIRWFKHTDQMELLFGLQLLARELRPCTATHQDQADRVFGCFLNSSGQTQHLLLPKGMGHSGQILTIRQSDGGKGNMLLGQQTEAGGKVEIFRLQHA